MIFGFNSDVKLGDTVYHVQSEVRQKERCLQTQVFAGGRCLSTRSAPLNDADIAAEPQIQEMLREQHRKVLEAIRAGNFRETSHEAHN
jgi:hypothetical protein